jgi:hypothetical protein
MAIICSIWRWRAFVILMTAVSSGVLVPAAGWAQTMSFSVYTDGWESDDGNYIDSSASVIDDSSGCNHINYMTQTRIISPSGRDSIGQSSGLSASNSLAIDDEFGDYTLVTTGTYACSCIMYNTAGFGGSAQTVTPRMPADIQPKGDDNFTYRSPGDYTRQRTWQVLDQNGQPWNYANFPVRENFTPVSGQNGCNLQVSQASGWTQPDGTFPDCYGNCAPNQNIPACASFPNCTSAFTQAITVAGRPFNNGVTYACSNVTIIRQ